MACGVAFEDAFGVAVPVEAAEGGESSGDGGSHASVGFHVSGEGLEVGACDVEEPDAAVGAPGDELAEVGGVADAGGAGVAGQERGDHGAFASVEQFLGADKNSDGCCGHGGLLEGPDLTWSGIQLWIRQPPHVTKRGGPVPLAVGTTVVGSSRDVVSATAIATAVHGSATATLTRR